MEPSTDLALEGLGRAIARLAGVDLDTDELGAAIATGEALLWIASLEDVIGRVDAPPLSGLRYVRDRIAHQAAITGAIHIVTEGLLGTTAFGTGPPLGTTRRQRLVLRWRERDQMPPPDEGKDWPDRRKAYDDQVAGRDVLPTLRGAQVILRRYVEGL